MAPPTTSTTAASTATTTMTEPMAGPLSQVEVEAWADELETIPPAYVEAWDSRDLDAIRLLFTEDIVFRDVGVPPVEGVDAMVTMAETMLRYELRDMRWRVLSDFAAGFVGGDGGLMILELWGFFGITEDKPTGAVYQLATHDGLIASIDLLYRDPTPSSVAAAYAAAWSSGDQSQIEALYDSAVVRRDTVFGVQTEGTEALSAAAARFLADHPDATWEVLMSFGTPSTAEGGLFAVHDAAGCPVRIAVIIRVTDGRIVHEEIYHEAASLLDCAWLG